MKYFMLDSLQKFLFSSRIPEACDTRMRPFVSNKQLTLCTHDFCVLSSKN